MAAATAKASPPDDADPCDSAILYYNASGTHSTNGNNFSGKETSAPQMGKKLTAITEKTVPSDTTPQSSTQNYEAEELVPAVDAGG